MANQLENCHRIFVTGASGFIGGRLCQYLAGSDANTVVAFCRAPSEAPCLRNPDIEVVTGDLLSRQSITAGMKGCDACIHLAGLASQWSRRADEFHRVNVDGTRNVLAAAAACGVRRFVFVSTAGVYGPTGDGFLSEDSPIPAWQPTRYERSKRDAELVVLQEGNRLDLNVCIVCPTRVFGPGELSEANSVTRIIQQYMCGHWRFLPGDGSAVGNYVYIDDVVTGLVQAVKLGVNGRRYVLGGTNLSYRELFRLVGEQCSHRQAAMIQVPCFAAVVYAQVQWLLASLIGRRPTLTPPFARKYFRDYRFNCERTWKELGMKPTSMEAAIESTVRWLNTKDKSTESVFDHPRSA